MYFNIYNSLSRCNHVITQYGNWWNAFQITMARGIDKNPKQAMEWMYFHKSVYHKTIHKIKIISILKK